MAIQSSNKHVWSGDNLDGIARNTSFSTRVGAPECSLMEPMTVHLVSVIRQHDHVKARARVSAPQARIMVEVIFQVGSVRSRRELWSRARDEVLRYLDVA